MMMIMIIFVYFWCGTALFRPLKRCDKKRVNSQRNSQNRQTGCIPYAKKIPQLEKKYPTAGSGLLTNMSYA